MSRFTFVPGNITVPKGQVMSMLKEDEVVHQVYVQESGESTGPLSSKAEATIKFNEPGTFTVRCTIDAGMRIRGKVQ